MYISDSYLEELISEDVPSVDLTTHVLGIGGRHGCIEYFTRDAGVLCGTEEAERIYHMLGAERAEIQPSGTQLAPGDVFMRVWGRAEVLHMGWKCCLNIFEYYSALATKTRAMVDAVHAENPRCEVLTTRKRMSGYQAARYEGNACGRLLPASPGTFRDRAHICAAYCVL